jgi:hypothetical protein
MKYIIYTEIREPMKDNVKKRYEIEEERCDMATDW